MERWWRRSRKSLETVNWGPQKGLGGPVVKVGYTCRRVAAEIWLIFIHITPRKIV